MTDEPIQRFFSIKKKLLNLTYTMKELYIGKTYYQEQR